MKRSLLKSTVLLLVLTATAFGQVDYKQFSFDLCGGGARAEGMGKAFLALSDDVTGGSWNPAGIYAIEGPVLGFSWGSLRPRGETTTEVFGSLDDNAVVWDHSGSQNNIGFISFAAPITVFRARRSACSGDSPAFTPARDRTSTK